MILMETILQELNYKATGFKHISVKPLFLSIIQHEIIIPSAFMISSMKNTNCGNIEIWFYFI